MNDDNLDPRFEDTVFVVEANSYERLSLWSKHCHQGSTESTLAKYKRYEWEQDNFGLTVEVGKIDNKPISITFFWFIIEGHRVAFYERNSWYIDLYQVDEWLKKYCNPTWNYGRRAHCNAMNFHHCLHAIDDLNKK
jgi:hypothetical protein